MEDFLKWGIYVITGGIAWILKSLWDAVQKLKSDVKNLEVKLPEEYISKKDMQIMFETLMRKLDKIETLFYEHINDAFKNRTDKNG